ncbi:MAG: DUF3300 domain-containing protein [Betaproteobacteria bacterium]|nr:DUF3300 domain-containing protein [Betaproteobacteria bacterium]
MLVLLGAAPARAADAPPFTQAQLDQMLASIALFPDPLLAQVLMAATYPSDVALAADWAYRNRQFKGDDAVKAVQDQPWDPSVKSLVAFPQALAMLGEKPAWVQDLGDAFLAQPEAVMDSVQYLRARAKEAGNLATNEQQIVTVEPAPPPPQVIVVNAPPPPTQIITIAPASPQVVFVPIYNPVWAFGPWWHPGFPPWFFPPPPRWGWSAGWNSGFWWGVGIGASAALWGGVNWRTRDVNINVNRWNTINVNNRIDSRDRDVNWRHDARNRHGVPYRDTASRERFQNAVGDRAARDDFRGRDDQRARAQAAVADRVGADNVSRDALRNIDRSQLPQRPAGSDRPGAARPQDRAGSIDRSQLPDRAANVDRSQLQNRAAGVDRSQVQNRAANIDRSQVQNRAAGMDRAQVQNRAAEVNRDNALRGAGNPQQVRQQVDRGNASRQAMQQRAPSGGNVQRAGGNVQRPAGNVQRPSGGRR